MNRGRSPKRFAALLAGALLAAGLASGAAAPAGAASDVDRCTDAAGTRSGRPVLVTPKGDAADPVVVGVKPLDPFVVRTGTTCDGFSIQLWDEIARRNGWTTQYVWEDTLPPLLDDVESRRVDAAVAGISITREREEKVDFSYPMFNAGLQVLVRRGGSGVGSVFADVAGVLSASVGRFVLALVVVLFLAGNAVWLSGRRHGDTAPYLAGVGQGMYRSAAVGLAGDFGTGDPRRPAGRVVAVAWVILGVCFVSLFTAAVTSRLTVRSIRSDISGVNDLGDKQVVTVKGSTAAAALTERGLEFRTVTAIEDAYPLLQNGSVDAVVFDAPVLQHYASTASGSVLLVGPVFRPEDYGVALPLSSPLRKQVNATLLDMRADGTYERIHTAWFGQPAG